MTLPPHIADALPALPIALPLLTAALLAALRSHLSRALMDGLAMLAAACSVADCALLMMSSHEHTIVYWFGNWGPRGSTVLGITFVIDPVSAGLTLLCSVLTLLALFFSWNHTDSGGNHLQPLMLVFLAGMSGFSLTGDLFNMFVWFELMSTAAFALTGLKTGEPAPLQGAFNFAVTNTVGAFMVLTGIAFLYAVTGALNIAQIGLALTHRHDPLVLFACALITCGFFTKAAVVPFHFWLADAHAVSPTPVCVLFSGVMVELGLYAVQRLYAVIFIPAVDENAAVLRHILIVFGVLTAMLGALMCYAEHHVKRLLAFSTISHAGLMLVALSIQGPLATAGFLTYLLSHAFVKAALFFVSGILLHLYRTASEPVLFGKARNQFIPAALWFLGGLGLAGFPWFATMLGDAMTSNAAEAVDMRWVSYVFLASGLLTAGAVFRVGLHTFLGWGSEPISDSAAKVDEEPDSPENARTRWFQLAAPALCVAAAIGLTLMPHFREEMLSAANRMWVQSGYLSAVYRNTTIPLPTPHSGDLEVKSAATHGAIASLLALLLALTSVFRGRLARWLRAGAFLEGPLYFLRAVQTGQIGDYVTWMTIGVAVMGAAFVFLLR
ncbi:MAG TPA: complex I subunit 5 family protein [Terracidiphilus sp.]|jgi:multicomponent Na+:H+ antiporter subunit D